MKRIHLIISGFVQGVGYRAWAVRQARNMGLSGWVKNRPDGAVELVAEGTEDNLDKLISECKKGPMVSDVSDVQIIYEDATGEFEEFRVLYWK